MKPDTLYPVGCKSVRDCFSDNVVRPVLFQDQPQIVISQPIAQVEKVLPHVKGREIVKVFREMTKAR